MRDLSRRIRCRYRRSSRLSSLVIFSALGLLAFFVAPSMRAGETVMHTVTLSWNPSSSENVTGYRVHYGQQSGNYPNSIDVGNQLTAEVANLIDGTTYYFAVTAYNNAGEESEPSEEFHYMPSPAVLLNLSTRAFVQTGDKVMIAGFVVGGIGEKKIIVRALGPSLSRSGVSGTLADPVLSLFSGNVPIATNDGWRSGNAEALRSLNLAPTMDAEPAIVITLKPGAYTAVVRGKNNKTGVALVEVYDAGPADAP